MASSVDVLKIDGEKSGSVDLPSHLFEAEISEYALYRAVVAFETNQRQGTASTKTRSEVQRSGRKHHRQKGTGQARRGTAASNLLRGGGVAFGPKPRHYQLKLTKPLKKKAMSSALSAKGLDGLVVIVEDFEYPEPSAKSFAQVLNAVGLEGQKVLFVTPEARPTIVKSCRNIPGVEIRPANAVSTHDIVAANVVLMTQMAVDAIAKIHTP